ncbi:MAG: heparan-alpha-glucosaminide N-acetyltransferase domain-containing protein [Chitinophagaceae bacterium]
MAEQVSTGRSRINSIDILRGIIMVIMALDHTRDFFHKTVVDSGASVATGPTDLATTTPVLFFTRWITHFCAPIFVFLAGTAVYLMSRKKTKAELSSFLIKRGCWLVLVEIIIITLSWTFNPLFNVIILQVIWAIGISMIILGLLIHLPFKLIFLIGFLIVFGHNLLDYPEINKGLKGGLLSDLLYFSNFSIYNIDSRHFIFIVYSFIPWTGVMLLGYCFGKLFSGSIDPRQRKKTLLLMGGGLVSLFIVLRFINLYGDPVSWSAHPRGPVFSFLSFINVNKYPPSLDFLSLTIGTGMLALALLEGVSNKLADFFRVYGRVPMFYYILHFYVIHTLVVIFFFAQGYPADRIADPRSPFLFRPPEFGIGLAGVYLIWLFVFLVLYPLCKKYDRYKTANAGQKWWLSYL